jgi:hypothetical protein
MKMLPGQWFSPRYDSSSVVPPTTRVWSSSKVLVGSGRSESGKRSRSSRVILWAMISTPDP